MRRESLRKLVPIPKEERKYIASKARFWLYVGPTAGIISGLYQELVNDQSREESVKAGLGFMTGYLLISAGSYLYNIHRARRREIKRISL